MISKNKFMSENDDNRLMITENVLRDMCQVKEFALIHKKAEDLYILISEIRE